MIHVDTTADASSEGNETVVVTLSPPGGGATLGTPSSTVLTIVDDEPTFAFTVDQITVKESQTSVLATVRRTGPLTTAASVNFTTTNGSATGGTSPGDDFQPTSGTLAFPAKMATRTIVVKLRPDADFEPTQAFSIDLSAPSVGMDLGSPSSLTVNIPNDDLGGTFSFVAASYTVLETKPSVLLTVKRTGGLANAQVSYETVDGTALSGNDFTGTGPTPLTFAAGKTSATITIPIIHDPAAEGTRSFTVPLSGATAGGSLGTPSTATVMIQDVETVVMFGAATYTVKEPTSGTATLLIPVKRVGPAGPFTVNYAVTGTANGTDFTIGPASPLSFGATELVKNLTLTVNSDGLFEGNETVVLTLSSPTGAGLGTIPVTTVTITDEDPVISFGAAAYSMSEPTGSAPVQALITVKRAGNLLLGSQVSYTISPGSAGDGSDYNSAGATPASPMAFLSGQSAVTIKVPILPDTEDEPNETFTVTLSLPANASLGSLSTTTVTIKDNDIAGRIQLAGTQFAVTEGVGTAVIKLTRTSGTAGNASVVCRTTDGSADGSDYTATAQTVTFGPGQTSATCSIPITDDGTAGEGAETVLVTIDTPSFGVILGTPNAATLYILDND